MELVTKKKLLLVAGRVHPELADEIVRDAPHEALAPFTPDRFFLDPSAAGASAELVGVKPVEGPA